MSEPVEVPRPSSTRCTAERETYRIGRNVAENTRCNNRTRHPSGKCHLHRSDDPEDDQP